MAVWSRSTWPGAIDCALAPDRGERGKSVRDRSWLWRIHRAALRAVRCAHSHDLSRSACLLFRAANGFPKAFERPKLFVTGEFDEICPLYKLEPFVEQLKGPKGIKVIVGARHLMRDYEEAAITAIVKYVKNWADMPGV